MFVAMVHYPGLLPASVVLSFIMNCSLVPLTQAVPTPGPKAWASRRVSAIVADGAAALERGDTVAAKNLFRRALALDATNVAAHTYLGIVADRADDLVEAERQFASAAEAAPSSPEARNNHGAILLRMGRKREAAAEFESSLHLNRKQPAALVNLAQIYFASGTAAGMQNARDLFRRAGDLAPDAEIARALVLIALRLGESEQAIAEYPEYSAHLGSAPKSVTAPSARADLGAALFEAKLFKEATAELTAGVAGDPADPAKVVLLARAYQEQKDFPAAGRALESAVARGMEAAPVYAALAEVYEASGHIENAIPAMRRAIQLDPKRESYRFRFAMLLTDSNAPQAAVIRLQEALEEFPHSAMLWFALGVAQFTDNKNDEAAKAFSRALEQDSKMAPALAYLGMIRVDQGKTADAVGFYERALALDEESSTIQYLQSEALVKLTPPDNNAAEAHLKRAIVLEPSLQQAHLQLGKLYMRTERMDEAARELEGVIRVDPNRAEAYYQLGRVYARLKKREAAQAAMAKFEELSQAEKKQSENERRDMVHRLANVRF